MIKLQAMKETIDPGRLGLISGPYTSITELDVRAYIDAVIRYAAAQALIDQISNVQGGIVVRDIMPDKDLLDGSGTAITSRDWRQPVSSNYTTVTGAAASAVSVYTTSRTSNNDRKVLIICGLKNVGSGPSREAAILSTNSMILKRSDVKTIDIWQIECLETANNQEIYGIVPVIFKRGDDANILFVPNAKVPVSASKIDRLQIIGKIAEALGANVTG